MAANVTTPLILQSNNVNNGDSGGDEEGRKALRFVKEFGKESKKVWKISGPAMFTSLAMYSFGNITQIFAGHVNQLDLATVSVQKSVVAGFAFGFMLGMGSALETLCGQAFGAGEIRMLGVYMQRSWVIMLTSATLLLPIYIWSTPILELIGETTEISQSAGRFSIWMLPQLYAYALYFPLQIFLQAQRKQKVMATVAGTVLVFHIIFSWLLILKLEWGLTGAVITLNTSWWLVVIGLSSYVFISKSDGAWSGFTWLAFADLWGFIKLSLASAVMLCLEYWYLMVLLVITGRLSNPLIAVDALSICLSLNGWDFMIAMGFTAAISVRVSNELGAGNFRDAKFAVVVVSMTSMSIGVVIMAIVYATRDYFPYLFTNSVAVARETTRLAILLGITVFLNSVQPVLSGVAIGAGWQSLVAYINIGCYYILGVPIGVLLGFTFKFGVAGIWSGMIGGTLLQTIILVVVTSLTNWKREAEQAESRVKKWGGAITYDQSPIN